MVEQPPSWRLQARPWQQTHPCPWCLAPAYTLRLSQPAQLPGTPADGLDTECCTLQACLCLQLLLQQQRHPRPAHASLPLQPARQHSPARPCWTGPYAACSPLSGTPPPAAARSTSCTSKGPGAPPTPAARAPAGWPRAPVPTCLQREGLGGARGLQEGGGARACSGGAGRQAGGGGGEA